MWNMMERGECLFKNLLRTEMTQKGFMISKFPHTISSGKILYRYHFFSYPFLPGHLSDCHCVQVHICTNSQLQKRKKWYNGNFLVNKEPHFTQALHTRLWQSTRSHAGRWPPFPTVQPMTWWDGNKSPLFGVEYCNDHRCEVFSVLVQVVWPAGLDSGGVTEN